MRGIISGIAFFLVASLILIAVLMVVSTVSPQVISGLIGGSGGNDNDKNDGLPDDVGFDSPSQNPNPDGNANPNLNANASDGDPPRENDSQTETETEDDIAAKIKNMLFYNGLELPVAGATGYASVSMALLQTPGNSAVITTLIPGKAFVVIAEDGDWWQVAVYGSDAGGANSDESDEIVGWVRHKECMINLPDVIPSIIYNDTNANSSMFRSSFEDIPNITGEQLYWFEGGRWDGKVRNPRLNDEYEYIMPVLYSMSKRICAAQKNALDNGDTLVIYEGYRPYDTQMRVVNELQQFANLNPEIRAGISSSPWNISWFIATGISNHQIGYAMDVSLTKISKVEEIDTGGIKCVRARGDMDGYKMPTPIHELSQKSATFTYPATIDSFTAWKSAELSDGMKNSPHALDLQRYCTDAGLTPLASEWWHFNDLDTLHHIEKKSNGYYFIKDCLSRPPS